MDHMDWFDPHGRDAINEIVALKKCLAPNGRVMLRSAAPDPWYIKTFESLGFKVENSVVRKTGESIDRVNMYASTIVLRYMGPQEEIDPIIDGRRRMSSLRI